MRTNHPAGRALFAGALLFGSIPLLAQSPVGQWDFNSGDLSGTGGALVARDFSGTGLQYGTTTALGLPDIGGAAAQVVKVPAGADASAGLSMPIAAAANANGFLLNDYTLVMDVLFPATSAGTVRGLLETDEGGFNPDAELFVTAANAFGTKTAAFGSLAANTWYRLGVVVDTNDEADNGQIRFYLDGTEIGTVNVSNLKDQRYALSPGGTAGLFTDDDGETADVYVNSIQLRDSALSKGQMRALEGPAAAGIPEVLPPVPSGVEKWIPAGAFASRTTPVGVIIAAGSATVQDSSIVLKVDDTILASPTITRDGELITVQATPAASFLPGTQHTVSVEYTDSLAGAKTFSHTFTAAVFFEDFEGLPLEPAKDEAGAASLAFTEGWTHTPPTGWTIDNSNFPATIISEENPDEDGDGYADLDGRTEWAGWSFANKDFWVAAEDQRRSEFALGQDTIAVADTDEWDDLAHLKSLFHSLLITPEISLTGLAPNSVFLQFASSWRPEARDETSPSDSTTGFPTANNDGVTPINNQTAIITARFDDGSPVQIMKWDSISGSPTYHDHAPNEQVLLPLNNPAGATKVVLTFALVDGGNDWWWAIDNVVVNAGAAPPLISGQPVPAEVTEGQPASLTVEATGDGLNYQWFKGFGTGKVSVAGATAATLSFASAQVSDGGYYSVTIKNAIGEVVSTTVKLTVLPATEGALVLLEENFDGLPLGPNIDEGIITGTPQEVAEAWTKTPPQGWEIDDTGVPGVGDPDLDGVTEWAGWSFANKQFWYTADDQSRSAFAKGSGTIAVADSDEWDDVSHADGNMATYLKTKAISLAGVKPGSVILKFDSSWNPENPQKANVTVAFDGGTPVEVLRFESDPNSANYHPTEFSETVAIAINNPTGAQNMMVTFGYFDTRNNWWWAFDNVLVTGKPAPLFFEDFEGLTLGPSVDEGVLNNDGIVGTTVWTKTAPEGWVIDDSGVPGVGTDQDGITEWAGWSFASREWWAATGGDQNRTQFTKGVGTVAIADSDEWDDVGHADGNMATFLTTRAIDITGQAANTLQLRFDSSWRAENPQKANVTVSFDNGPAVEILRWESSGALLHPDATDETVTLPLGNPEGATSLKITFGYFDTRNNWWWAIDNIEVFVGEPATGDLEIGTAELTPDGLQLTWAGGTGPYLVQGKLDLADPEWIDLQSTTETTTTIPLAAPLGLFRVVDGTTKTVQFFQAYLNGANERPTPNDQPGTGIGLLALDGLTATYIVSYENLSTTPHLYHLHGLGGPEEAVGVKFSLVPAGDLGTSGLFVGSATVDQETADGIVQGRTYFNIHTPGTYSGGEIRGQVVPVP